MPENELEKPPTGLNVSWKDWLIGALWILTMVFAAVAFSSITESVQKVYTLQTKTADSFAEFKIENERRWSDTMRMIDRICNYQAERLNKEGRSPDYRIERTR